MAKTQVQQIAVAENREFIQAGGIVGILLGMVLGFTFWTHTPDVIHFGIAVVIALTCMFAGAVIGRIVCKMESTSHH